MRPGIGQHRPQLTKPPGPGHQAARPPRVRRARRARRARGTRRPPGTRRSIRRSIGGPPGRAARGPAEGPAAAGCRTAAAHRPRATTPPVRPFAPAGSASPRSYSPRQFINRREWLSWPIRDAVPSGRTGMTITPAARLGTGKLPGSAGRGIPSRSIVTTASFARVWRQWQRFVGPPVRPAAGGRAGGRPRGRPPWRSLAML